MAVTDLKSTLARDARAVDDSHTSDSSDPNRLAGRLTALESEFRLLREEFVRTRDIIEEREKNGRTLIEAYKQVMSDFTNLFEAQRKENLKRDESVRFLLSSVENRILSDLDRLTGQNGVQDSGEAKKPFWRK
jgi:hypothetical protein